MSARMSRTDIKHEGTALELKPSHLLEAAKDNASIMRFFLTSHNDMVAYHRQVAASALLPILIGLTSVAAVGVGVYDTPFAVHSAYFINLLALCYAAEVIRGKLLPRDVTYEKWNEYMSSVRHNRHVCSVLMAYHMQMEYGDAPAEGSEEAATLPKEVYNIWRTKNHGLSLQEVQTKYVNFCWRYTYRLWCNKLRLGDKDTQSTHSLPQPADETLEHPTPAMTGFHGDTPTHESAMKLVDASENMKLNALQKIAGRVNKFAEGLSSGGPADGASTSAEHPHSAEHPMEKLHQAGEGGGRLHGFHEQETHPPG